MELDEAATQISEIHTQMLKSEVFRGYRTWPMLTTGVLALVAALLQTGLVGVCDPGQHAAYWVVIALACATVAFGDLAFVFWREESRGQRERILKAVGQILPGLAAGAAVTVALLDTPAADLLPGLWMILFALCIFGSRLFLPRAVGVVALFYLCAGTILLLDPSGAVSPFSMGLPFACGQLGLAVVLHRNLARVGG